MVAKPAGRREIGYRLALLTRSPSPMPTLRPTFFWKTRNACMAALLALSLGPLWAQENAAPEPPATPLERAVQAYESGDLKAAARAFTALSAQARPLPLADYNLAMMHLREELPKPSPRRAERLLKRAAAGGLVRAELALAQLYEQGLLGKPNLAQALTWNLRAAERGSSEAQVALATAYYLGRGTPPNPEQAAHWFREAAKSGDVGAQYLLASMYETGLGVPADLRLARYWYDIAARNGDEGAPYKLKAIDAQLGLAE
ncbi:MAG: hypothetical protein CFE41_22000 [Burkholderiales bacterium PBB2]|nr:MAG: hypothetical protein CFE41_22000 [Burkholderiales bacterium PBB2]